MKGQLRLEGIQGAGRFGSGRKSVPLADRVWEECKFVGIYSGEGDMEVGATTGGGCKDEIISGGVEEAVFDF